jgi:antirestriction protein ArdC
MANEKIYQLITERIVTKLIDAISAIEKGELGIAPWNRPWFNTGNPINLVSKKEYKGINVFMLSSLGYPCPYFVTFNQAKKLGGKVTKGQKGCPVVYWKVTKYDKDQNGKPYGVDGKGNKIVKKSFMLRYYTVFNVQQCEGFESKIPALEIRKFNPIHDAEKIIADMPNPPAFGHGMAKAFYSPSKDAVNMPRKELFKSEESYYSTAFHELIHSTGHTSRLNRDEVNNEITFGNHAYSKEELVAEMGAIYLCNQIGLESTEGNSLAYLKSWLGKLKDDVKMLITASGKAQKAADFILDTKRKAELVEEAKEKEEAIAA